MATTNVINGDKRGLVYSGGRLVLDWATAIGNELDARLHAWGICAAGGLCLPDFLGIGTPQSGTTWLHRCLQHHPELYLPQRKELQFFNYSNCGPTRRIVRLKSYSRFFEPGRDRIKGEISPNYCAVSPWKIRYIHGLMPKLKLILVVRNPIDRTWSAARRVLAKRYAGGVDDWPEEAVLAFFDDAGVQRQSDYLAILDNWTAVFDVRQLHIAQFDDIAARPEGLLRDIFQFLGVDGDPAWSAMPLHKAVNKNLSKPISARYRQHLKRTYQSMIERLGQRYDIDVGDWLCDA